MQISSFWMGAIRFGHSLDLGRMAKQVGGWESFISMGARGLVAAGVSPLIADRWMQVGSSYTRGIAINLADPRYPALLKTISCPPPVLFVEGNLEVISRRSVAVVGTRGCTPYGASVARRLAAGLASRGIVVVSGLARGIDGHAHQAAADNGQTIAVLGHGLEYTAPASHRELRAKILANNGAVLTAFPDHVEPRPYTFPARNVWISGLSEAIVVIEAPRRSGALLTASVAGDQGRDVWVVPGPLDQENSIGCLELIAAGAYVITDIHRFCEQFSDVSPVERRLPPAWLQALFAGSSLDRVAESSGQSISELIAELSRLEIRGEVVRLPGQRYSPGRGWS